jgi:hypothetical protein
MEEYIVRVYEDRTEWIQNGQWHRTDGPAVEYTSGDKFYYQNGQQHRTDGPAIERADGGKFWYLNGQSHRIDGPAMECANGDKYWYQNGNRHRTDGPASEYANGTKEYWIEWVRYTEEEFLKKTQPSVEELTVAEISKRLGYEVKIVKE